MSNYLEYVQDIIEKNTAKTSVLLGGTIKDTRSLSKLTESDIQAVADYLKAQESSRVKIANLDNYTLGILLNVANKKEEQTSSKAPAPSYDVDKYRERAKMPIYRR